MNLNFDLLFENFYSIFKHGGIVDLEYENTLRKIVYGKELKNKLTEFSLKTLEEIEEIRREYFPVYSKMRKISESSEDISFKNFATIELIRIIVPDPDDCLFVLSRLVDDRRY